MCIEISSIFSDNNIFNYTMYILTCIDFVETAIYILYTYIT